MSPKSSVTVPLIWRRYHSDGEICPSAPKKERPAQFANAGERKPTLGRCGCTTRHPGSYYQADVVTETVPESVMTQQEVVGMAVAGDQQKPEKLET